MDLIYALMVAVGLAWIMRRLGGIALQTLLLGLGLLLALAVAGGAGGLDAGDVSASHAERLVFALRDIARGVRDGLAAWEP